MASIVFGTAPRPREDDNETTLLTRYSKNDDDEIDRWLLAESTTVKPTTQQAPPKPAQPAVQEPGSGFFNSLKRAAWSPFERVAEGYETMKSAGAPAWETRQQLPEGGTMTTRGEPSMLQRIGTSAGGLLTAAFPFTAPFASLAKDFVGWMNSGVTPEQADAELQDRLVQLRELAAREPRTGGGPSSTVQAIQQIEQLLTMPHAERLKRAQEAAGMAVDVVGGLVAPGGYGHAARGVLGAVNRGRTAAQEAAHAAAHAARVETIRQAGERIAARALPQYAGPERLGGSIPGYMNPLPPGREADTTLWAWLSSRFRPSRTLAAKERS